MSTGLVVLDRIASFIVGLVLLAAGIGAVGWRLDWWPGMPGRLRADGSGVVDTAWWPWALGAAGVLLVVLALRWLLAHAGRRRITTLTLTGSGRQGRLLVDTEPLASALAETLADQPGVRTTGARVVRDRDEVVLEVSAEVDPAVELGTVGSAADAAAADLRQMIGETALRCRVLLSAQRRQNQTLRRVS